MAVCDLEYLEDSGYERVVTVKGGWQVVSNDR
jgi:hypothetical protein